METSKNDAPSGVRGTVVIPSYGHVRSAIEVQFESGRRLTSDFSIGATTPPKATLIVW